MSTKSEKFPKLKVFKRKGLLDSIPREYPKFWVMFSYKENERK